MVPYPRLAQFNYLQRPKTPLVCILRRNQGGGGVVKQPTLNMYYISIMYFVPTSDPPAVLSEVEGKPGNFCNL
jgi:hypothetical protein